MKRQTELTKSRLEDLGVTDVKEDGTVYVRGEVKRPNKVKCTHKYGRDRQYLAIILSDKSIKKKTKRSWVYKTVTLSLGRLMLAWFNGSIPADMDADHIDGNPFNNNINNLQMLTRKENLAKRFKDNPNNQKNQYAFIKGEK